MVELVGGEVVEKIAVLAVVLGDGAVLVAGDDVFAQVAPPGNGGLALVADDGQGLLVRLLRLHVDLDVEHNDCAQMPHALLRHAQQLGAILVELDALDGRGEVPCLEELAGLDLPEADGVVGGTGGDDGGGGVDIDGPDGTLVTVVCAETLAVVREPTADLLVLCGREDEIAFAVISGVAKPSQMLGPNM